MMKNQEMSREHGTLLSFYTPTKTNRRTGKNNVKKDKTVPSYQLTPESSPCSGEEAESVHRSDKSALGGPEKEMNKEVSPEEPATKHDSTPTTDPSSKKSLPDTQTESVVGTDLTLDDNKSCVVGPKDSKADPTSRRQRCKSPQRQNNIEEWSVDIVGGAVSPSIPKLKVRRGIPKAEDSQQGLKPKPGRKKKTQPELVQKNTITNYYQVRRSSRQTKSEIEKAKQQQLEQQILDHCEDGLEVKYFENKGRGVVATKQFQKGDFVVEYAGELIDPETAKLREEKYGETPEVGCYMYYFCCASKQYCIDATAESPYLGRLLNHSRDGNCCTRAIVIDQKPRLYLLASRDIKPGEELTYDYGDRRKEALNTHPWLKL